MLPIDGDCAWAADPTSDIQPSQEPTLAALPAACPPGYTGAPPHCAPPLVAAKPLLLTAATPKPTTLYRFAGPMVAAPADNVR